MFFKLLFERHCPKMKRQATGREKIFAKHMFLQKHKGLVSRIHKEVFPLSNKTT